MYNQNDETDKIRNLRKALNHLADNESTNQLIIGDYNTRLNTDLYYVDYSQDPHRALREFLHCLQDNGVFILSTGSYTPMI